MTVEAKICGLKTKDVVAAAIEGGARSVGFVFFERSPRNVTLDDVQELTTDVPKGIIKVGLVVDASDDFLADISSRGCLDMIQFHGHESPDRVVEVKERYGLQVMKVIAIAGSEDLTLARDYEGVADRLMFDAKPPKDATRPGGNAVAFDWQLLQGLTWQKPWVLAGGLTPENVAEAVRISGASAVDVSSGVEDAPGVKSIAKIKEFLDVVGNL
ncbi:MAG: phosphoribosylanthranilate isomerase [Rhodospirillales bacterium]|jgi:phosphoribosylanthranilate isomerase|nr:phosphoribosylanthranilate isomerase [Rhodospirillales bacterium]